MNLLTSALHAQTYIKKARRQAGFSNLGLTMKENKT